MSQPTAPRGTAPLFTTLTLTLLTVAAWLRGDAVADERGSDASEKALMVILGITIGGIVTVAAVAFINSKTSLFK
jgi:hypothetical protein